MSLENVSASGGLGSPGINRWVAEAVSSKCRSCVFKRVLMKDYQEASESASGLATCVPGQMGRMIPEV